MSGRPKEFDDVAVIEAAMDVFWSNGYNGSSAQALCDRTGLGRGSATTRSAANMAFMNRHCAAIRNWASRRRRGYSMVPDQ